jgi:hypothetical protein
MDLGFVGEPETGELEALIRSACLDAAQRRITHLTAFTSNTAPEAPLLQRLAQDIQEFEFFGPREEPANIASRGIYVDPVYF